jgi:hypothetical protein
MKIVDRKELAKIKRVSVDTIRNWERWRIIPFFKIKHVIRFDLEKVEEALKQFERQAAK